MPRLFSNLAYKKDVARCCPAPPPTTQSAAIDDPFAPVYQPHEPRRRLCHSWDHDTCAFRNSDKPRNPALSWSVEPQLLPAVWEKRALQDHPLPLEVQIARRTRRREAFTTGETRHLMSAMLCESTLARSCAKLHDHCHASSIALRALRAEPSRTLPHEARRD